MNKKMRVFLTIAAALVLVAASIGGTVAYLKATTDPVTNTFTPASITITLTETFNTDTNNDGTNDSWTAKLIPGSTPDKDPKVTVEEGSEKCWVFIEMLNTHPAVVLPTLTNKWEKVDGVTPKTANATVYRYNSVVDASAADQVLQILADDKVTINPQLVDMPTEDVELTFKAYAVQSENLTVSTAADIWGLI